MTDVFQANPPQLHSNLLYIQRYRSQSRLVAEAAYFFTNMLSAESFISNIDAKALSMEESEFQNNMESAQALLSGLSTDMDGLSNLNDQNAGHVHGEQLIDSKHQARNSKKEKEPVMHPKSSERKSESKKVTFAKDQTPITKVPSLSELENKGATMLLKEDKASQVFREYPYLFAQVGDLTINDVEDLLNNYKQLVFNYVCLSKGLGSASPSLLSSNLHTPVIDHAETVKEPEDHKIAELNDESHKDTGMDDSSKNVLVSEDEDVESHLLQVEVDAHQGAVVLVQDTSLQHNLGKHIPAFKVKLFSEF
ncbi:hypothetical protein JRO89_XS07G0161200 [Xanthoceras sorbifolium]|uniref:VPS9 domain-containing protein n=1 Tax=Xanthoceras sorbifolium TaxID=99658 RepID=A0ABQ8HU82_9ROSI|nr:hypothetical protein JRO89_XS07G0161200 [Xanthoceras sorbifolium]